MGNLDYNGKEVIIEYERSDLFVPPDFNYKDSWDEKDLPFGTQKREAE